MTETKLREYPILIDASLDFEATREHFGTGSCNYAVGERILSSGERVVYVCQQREGPQVVNTPRGPARVCEKGIIVCGYKVNPTGFFKCLKGPKIRTIPYSERQGVQSELLGILKDNNFVSVDFDN